MIDYLKDNWKIAVAGLITTIVVVCLCCCNSEVEEAQQELSDEEIEKLF